MGGSQICTRTVRTHTHTHPHTPPTPHIHTHTYTHTHTHTQIQKLWLLPNISFIRESKKALFTIFEGKFIEGESFCIIRCLFDAFWFSLRYHQCFKSLSKTDITTVWDFMKQLDLNMNILKHWYFLAWIMMMMVKLINQSIYSRTCVQRPP